MSLVLSTQARFSSFLPGHERRDEEIRLNVEDLGTTVRWRMHRIADGVTSPERRDNPNRLSLQRNSSLNNGRYRRKGWRASSHFGQTWGIPSESNQPMISRQMSESTQQVPEIRWGRPRVDEEDDDDQTPGQSVAYPRNTVRDDTYSTAPSTLSSTLGASTLRGDSVSTFFDMSQKTPVAEGAARRMIRGDSGSDLTPVANVRR